MNHANFNESEVVQEHEKLDIPIMEGHYNRMRFKSRQLGDAASKIQNAEQLDTELFDSFGVYFDWSPTYEKFKQSAVSFVQKVPADEALKQDLEFDEELKEAYNQNLTKIGEAWHRIFVKTHQMEAQILALVPFFFVSKQSREFNLPLDELENELWNSFVKTDAQQEKWICFQALLMIHAIKRNENDFVEIYQAMIRELKLEEALNFVEPLLSPLFGNDFELNFKERLLEQNIDFISNIFRQKDDLSILEIRKIANYAVALSKVSGQPKMLTNGLLPVFEEVYNAAADNKDVERAMELFSFLSSIYSTIGRRHSRQELESKMAAQAALFAKTIDDKDQVSVKPEPPYRIGYFQNSESAETDVVFANQLKAHEQFGSDKFEVFYYDCGQNREDRDGFRKFFNETLQSVSSDHTNDDLNDFSQCQFAQKIRKQAEQDELDIAVFSPSQINGYLSIARIAPIQIFQSHRSTQFPYDVDGYQTIVESMKSRWQQDNEVNVVDAPLLKRFIQSELVDQLVESQPDAEDINQLSQRFDLEQMMREMEEFYLSLITKKQDG